MLASVSMIIVILTSISCQYVELTVYVSVINSKQSY